MIENLVVLTGMTSCIYALYKLHQKRIDKIIEFFVKIDKKLKEIEKKFTFNIIYKKEKKDEKPIIRCGFNTKDFE